MIPGSIHLTRLLRAASGTPSGSAACWALTTAGVLLLALGALVTPWLQTVQLRCDRDLMRAQRNRLALKVDRHDRFIAAVQDRDPTVLSRLQYERRRAIPPGAMVVRTFETDTHHGGQWLIERWLDVPMVMTKPNQASIYAERSLLVRITTGTGRIWVALAGTAAITTGIWLRRSPAP